MDAKREKGKIFCFLYFVQSTNIPNLGLQRETKHLSSSAEWPLLTRLSINHLPIYSFTITNFIFTTPGLDLATTWSTVKSHSNLTYGDCPDTARTSDWVPGEKVWLIQGTQVQAMNPGSTPPHSRLRVSSWGSRISTRGCPFWRFHWSSQRVSPLFVYHLNYILMNTFMSVFVSW